MAEKKEQNSGFKTSILKIFALNPNSLFNYKQILFCMKNNKKKSNHNIQIEDVNSYLNTNKETGLTKEEVLIRRQKFGTNVLVKAKKEPFIISFLKTLIFEPMSLLLFITGLIGLALAIYENIRGVIIDK